MKNRQTLLMEKARNDASFNTLELTCLIYGGHDNVERRRAAFERVETRLGVRDNKKLPRCYTGYTREDAYNEGLEEGKAAFEDGLQHQHAFFETMTPRCQLSNASPFGLTGPMFEATVRFCGLKEQKDVWLPLTKSGQIIGAYCQTELGHGTFVRGIETTATFDQQTDKLILNSPSVSSTKFWPGALGFSCTHAIVLARLVVNNTDHGPHFFVVQLRSLDDGTPLPGITLGDIGPKMSYNGTCNGFASFDHVRIPRMNMLMRYSQLDADGSYIRHGQPQLLYATMLALRGVILKISGLQLAQAVTIATRYSVVREQGVGFGDKSTTETVIFAYKTQHFRLLTIAAKSYAIFFISEAYRKEYADLILQQEMSDHSGLPYMHCLASGLKAWSTQTVADGAEDARKCCGGHGYMMISGIPDITATATALATLEGENYVLWQQVGRYLFKCLDNLEARKLIEPQMTYVAEQYKSYLNNVTPKMCPAQGNDFLDHAVQLSIYRHRALRLMTKAWVSVRSSSKPVAEAWSEHMLSIIDAGRAHIEYIILLSFVNAVATLPVCISGELHTVLDNLCSLFALSNLINPTSVNVISFIEDGHLSSTQLDRTRSIVSHLLERLRPEAIALTDAWDFTDASLRSALGCWDGNVYERIMSWVKQMPINQKAWNENQGVYQPGWREWIEPVLKANL